MAQHIRGHDRRCAGRASELDQELPDRAAAEDANAFARADLRQPDGMQGHAERLEHRHVGVAQAVGHGHEAAAGPGHEVAQKAVRGAVTGEAKRET